MNYILEKLTSNKYIKAALVRAIRTMAQVIIAMIGTTVTMGEVDWPRILSATILAGLLSLLTSIATDLPEVKIDHKE